MLDEESAERLTEKIAKKIAESTAPDFKAVTTLEEQLEQENKQRQIEKLEGQLTQAEQELVRGAVDEVASDPQGMFEVFRLYFKNLKNRGEE